MSKNKPLTEKGNLKTHFSFTPKNFKLSVNEYKMNLENVLLHKDNVEFQGRFEWVNLPSSLNQEIIENLLYHKGQLCLFKVADKYYILPFVFIGKINHYGIQEKLRPITYSGNIVDKDNEYFAGEYKLIYSQDHINEISEEEGAIILKAYPGIHLNNVIPPIALLKPIREKLIENLILIRNNLILSQPIKYVLSQNEEQAKSLRIQVDNLLNDILNGDVIQMLTSVMQFQNIDTNGPDIKSSELWQSFESLNALRLETLGILTNGVFEKRERFLSDEVAGKQSVSKIHLEKALQTRKNFCELANKFFKLNMDVKLSKSMNYNNDKQNIDRREINDNL